MNAHDRPKRAIELPDTEPEDRPARDRVLDAAAEVFLERGFEHTSMELVATRARVARRTVFNLFDSKDSLFRAAVSHAWKSMPIEEIGADEDHSNDPRDGLLRMGNAIANYWAAPQAVAMVQLVINEQWRFPQLAQDYLSYGKVPALNSLICYLRAAAASNALDIEDADLAARQFVGMINEPLLWFRVLGMPGQPTRTRRTQVVREAVTTFLARYVRAR